MPRPKKQIAKPARAPKGMGTVLLKGGKYYGRLRRNGQEIWTEAHESEGAAEQALARLRSGGLDPRFYPTLQDYWLSLVAIDGPFEHSKGANTCNLYESMLALHVRGTPLGRMRIDHIRKHDVQKHIDRAYSPEFQAASVRRLGSCIRTVLQEAVDAGMLFPRLENGVVVLANPADGIRYRKAPEAPAYILSDQELADYPLQMWRYSTRLAAMFTVLADTGARPAEVCAMRHEDIQEGVWTVWRQMSRSGKEVPHTKTLRVRTIALTQDALAAIAEQETKKGYVFLTEDGTPVRPDGLSLQLRRFRAWLQAKWDQAAKDAGVEEAPQVPALTPRNLRKTFITRGVELGDAKSAQILAGHSSSKTTLDVYAKGRKDPQRALIGKLQAQVSGRFPGLREKDRESKSETSSRAEPA